MKKMIWSVLVYLPMLLTAQNGGIQFEQNLTWAQIKAKAKLENKYIFLDCFATWCGPCKRMDDEVYALSEVGGVYNNRFISVKIQVDKTKNDNEFAKKWYGDAEELCRNFNISVFPSYLFFCPDGRPAHKDIGFKAKDAFITLANDAVDPTKQYYRMVNDFKPGVLDTSEMKGIARAYKRIGNELSEKIVLDYFNRIPVEDRFKENNLKFLSEFNESKKIQEIANNYLAGLSEQEFGRKVNLSFAVTFCNNNNNRAQELCAAYLKKLSDKEFVSPVNVKFSTSISALPAIQDIIIDYLERISLEEWGNEENMELAQACRKSEKVQTTANKYIADLKFDKVNTKAMVEFVREFTKSTSDPGFQLFYNHMDRIDLVMNDKDYGVRFVDYLIDREMVHEYFLAGLKGVDVPWAEIEKKIKNKYGKVDAFRIVLNSRVALYANLVKMPGKYTYTDYFNLAIEQVNRYGPKPHPVFGVDGGINSLAWDIFERSSDTTQINIAIKWMKPVIERNTTNGGPKGYYVDTYANLLYKIGRVEEAKKWESQTPYKDTYEKMLAGLPTWPIASSR